MRARTRVGVGVCVTQPFVRRPRLCPFRIILLISIKMTLIIFIFIVPIISIWFSLTQFLQCGNASLGRTRKILRPKASLEEILQIGGQPRTVEVFTVFS
jgi:hypothetical protein